MFKSRGNKKVSETEFTKADLKSGMVVQFRNGARCLVVDQCFISNRFHIPFDNVNDNLDGKYTTAKDIMRVYEPVLFLSDLSEASTRKILWERDEAKEVTMTEVEEKFGCKVKIIMGEPKPHGRLIDADRLLSVIEENSYRLKNFYNSCDKGMFLSGIKQAISAAPTIIEAEE